MLSKRLRFWWVSWLIGLIIGYFITRNLIEAFIAGVLLGGIAFYLHGMVRSMIIQHAKEKRGFLATEQDYLHSILALAAVIIKSDRDIAEIEKRFVEQQILKGFSTEKSKEHLFYLEQYLEQDIDHQAICKVIAEEFTYSSKYQLFYLLVRIATLDGLLRESEYRMLKELGIRCRFPKVGVDSILSMFHFETEAEQRRARSKTKRSGTSLRQAFLILGIDESANEKEIKKAYRQLAIIHHPDKVIHLGEEFQLAAKEKFQKILDAYETIKKAKGIK
ncbi:MAG: DnaJ domain-containing protein [Flavobacteriales bacterium]|nr:DnaJ domain-containing protein [Flavobacteriales bacterium]